jgi:rod shape-determining protein MreD
MARRSNPVVALPLSFLVAFLLASLPLPQAISYWRPEFVTMVLIFWVLNTPTLVGVWTGFILGVLLDVLLATPFGLHPMMLAVVAWLAQQSWRRVAVFSLAQTSLLVLVLVLIGLVIKRVLLGVVTTTPPDSWWYWLPAFTSALIWPTVMVSLRRFSLR